MTREEAEKKVAEATRRRVDTKRGTVVIYDDNGKERSTRWTLSGTEELLWDYAVTLTMKSEGK